MERGPSFPEMTTTPSVTDATDIAIGVLTAGVGSSMPTVTKVVQEGLRTHLSGLTAAIIHLDPTMPDEQAGQVEPIADGIRLVHARPTGTLSTGTALNGWSESVRTVLGLSRTFHTRAVVMLNADIASMTSDWVRGLAHPVLKDGCAFVLPIYERGRYEGTLTQLFVTPLVRALFGHQFWHPMADEFGPQPPLGSTVGRVAGALFSIAERHEAGWLDVHGSEPVALFGIPPGPAKRVAAMDPARMIEGFRQGVRDLLPIWERILSPESLGDVLVLSEHPTGEFRLADSLWARIVYDFLLAYRARVMYRSHIAQSLAPLYLGCAASLVLETRDRSDPAVAHAAERLARTFETEKSYLVDRWR